MITSVQPEPLELTTDCLPLTGEAFYLDALRRAEVGDFRLPNGSAEVGPLVSVGDCLPGLSEHGDLNWYSPTVTPRHGDLVVVRWGDRAWNWLCAEHGHEVPRLALKLLRAPSILHEQVPTAVKAILLATRWPDYLLACRSGQLALADNEILGTLTRKTRHGTPLYI